jgi:UDP-glucose 4-epimerase
VRLVVVGCRGFLGSVIAGRAAAGGHEVLGIARSSQPDPGFAGHYVQADAAAGDLAPTLRDFAAEAVVHAAGSASVRRSLEEPAEDFRASVVPWVNVLDGIRRSQCGAAALLLSSAAVYGSPARLPAGEDTPVAPISPYGYHKWICETVGREYAACHGLRVAHLRLFSVLGPHQRKLLVWELFQRAKSGSLAIEGTGEETRDYLHEDDVASAVVALADRHRGRPAGEVLDVNVASGVETRVRDLAALIGGTVTVGKSTRAGDPVRWHADITRLKSLLSDWRPRSLAAALESCRAGWR